KDNRIIIPSVLVDAPIVEGITSKALTQGVGHISGTAYPGEEGNCILEGHNLAEFGLWGKQSFFSLLDVLRKGAKVYVFYNGKKYVYKVEEKKKLEISNPKLYRDTHREQLTLITCVSTWSPTIYTKWRTVIICKPVKR
ncbi:MAG: sortase, partial [Actinomycetota bacterium]